MSSSTAQQGRDVGESVLATATDKTKSLYSKATNNWLVASYVRPAGTKVKGLYDRCPILIKVTLLALAALSAIPLACFFGFMAMVTAGCLIVGGIAFTIVEGGFATFASAFLIPTLGVTGLMASGVGMTVLVARVCYKMLMYGVGFFKSPDLKAEAEKRSKDMMHQAGEYVRTPIPLSTGGR
ncbi:hypothetical protein CPC16_004612 [Podila verticillata]|nr:hypothetical protein CPC16_004612 [Podila verticillata]